MEYLFTKDGFDIYFEELNEYMAVEDVLSFKETGIDHSATIKKVNDGTYAYFTARVIAYKNGVELADDYLCGCIYDSVEQFTSSKGDYFDDMVSTVISEAKEKIKSLCEAS